MTVPGALASADLSEWRLSTDTVEKLGK